MEWFFVAKEKRSKKTGTDRLLQKKLSTGILFVFPLFF
jgi:hypothetical protein